MHTATRISDPFGVRRETVFLTPVSNGEVAKKERLVLIILHTDLNTVKTTGSSYEYVRHVLFALYAQRNIKLQNIHLNFNQEKIVVNCLPLKPCLFQETPYFWTNVAVVGGHGFQDWLVLSKHLVTNPTKTGKCCLNKHKIKLRQQIVNIKVDL